MSRSRSQPRQHLVRDQIKSVPVTARLLPSMRLRLSNFESSEGRRVSSIEIQREPFSPWQGLCEPIQDTADVLYRQEPYETLDTMISAIVAAQEESRWASPRRATSNKIVRYGHVINTFLKATVAAICGFVLLGSGWLMILTIRKAL